MIRFYHFTICILCALFLTEGVYANEVNIQKILDDQFAPAVYKSLDGGITWSCSGSCNIPVWSIAISNQNPQLLYVGTSKGMYKTLDGGIHWQFTGLSANMFSSSIAIDPTNAAVVYAASYPNLYKTMDGGNIWKKIGDGLTCAAIADIVIDSMKPSTVYAAATCDNDANDNPLKGSAIFRSDDAGEHWYATALQDQLMLSVAVNPHNNSNLYAGTSNGLYGSDNGGNLWIPLPLREYTRSIVFASKKSNDVYATTNDGVFKLARDGSWIRLNLRGKNQQVVWNFLVYPLNPSILYANIGDIRGTWKSIDAGLTWKMIGPTNTFVNKMAIDPINPYLLYASSN